MPRVHKTAAYSFKASSRRLFISLVMIVGLLFPLMSAPAALAAEEAQGEASSTESVGAKPLQDLKNKDQDKVVPSMETSPPPSIARPAIRKRSFLSPRWIRTGDLDENCWIAGTATSKAFTGAPLERLRPVSTPSRQLLRG